MQGVKTACSSGVSDFQLLYWPQRREQGYFVVTEVGLLSQSWAE